MLTFSGYLRERSAGHPTWLKLTSTALVLKVRGLAVQIEKETDPAKQNALIAHQNKLISYINGLGIAVGMKDRTLLGWIRSLSKRWWIHIRLSFTSIHLHR